MIDLDKLHCGIKMDDDEAYEQLEELVSIQNPKPLQIIKRDGLKALVCPSCWRGYGLYENHWSYCPYCGQALDWNKEEEKAQLC